MNECLTSPDIMAKIKDDVEVGNKAGVNATPTIFINGRKYLGERTAPLIRAAAESL
jgi:protein-disulfide isomerase